MNEEYKEMKRRIKKLESENKKLQMENYDLTMLIKYGLKINKYEQIIRRIIVRNRRNFK